MGNDKIKAGTRRDCLEQATECVTSDRAAAYGEPEDNFGNIADIWSAQGVRIYQDSHGAFRDEHRSVNATDVALMMAGMKLARLRYNPGHNDSWVDMAGYAACGMEIANAPATPDVVPASVYTPTKVDIDSGWVSNERCPDPENPNDEIAGYIGTRSHVAHRFGRDSGRWCDGYI